MTIDNQSKFTIDHIQIDAEGEWVKVKLVSPTEHRLVASWHGRSYLQTLWLSPERQKDLGVEVKPIVYP